MEVSKPALPRRVLLLSHARTASHLFERMLSAQRDTCYASHFFAQARPLQTKLIEQGPLAQTSEELQTQLMQAFQSGFNSLEKFVTDAHENHAQTFFHDHPLFIVSPVVAAQFVHGDTGNQNQQAWTVRAQCAGHTTSKPRTNPTVLPDAFLLEPGTVPIFTIRHPLLMVPSIYRAITRTEDLTGPGLTPSVENLRFTCTFRWSRMLFDWFIEHGVDAVVIDAKEYMSARTVKGVMAKLCEKAGLDADQVIYVWPRATKEEIAALPGKLAELKKDILNSEGLRLEKDDSNVVAVQEEEKWRKEFGDETAVVLKDLVARTMSDYQYMSGKAIKDE